MRITNNMLTKNYLNNLSKNLSKLQKLQEQGSTGKAVNRASDDPVLVNKIMNLRNNIGENEHYNNTISEAIAWNQTQDNALDGAAKSMRRIRDLTISAARDNLSETDRKAITDEVEAEINTLKDIFNTNFDGRYVFGGQRTLEKPFEFDEDGILKYTANLDGKNNKNISREIAKGIEVDLVTDGNRLVDGEPELGVLLNDLLKDIEEGNVEKLSGETIGVLDSHYDNLIGVRTQIGAVDNRLEAAKGRNESENIHLKTVLSTKEDVDIVENYMETILMSTVYQASLSAGAKILQPSLLDYLR